MSEAILSLPPPPADHRIPYGPHPSQFGDLRLPQGPGPHPVVIALHGGFWRARYDLEHLGHLCAAFAAEGFAVWSLEYRRIGEEGGGWPGTGEDVLAGALHLERIAEQFRLDVSRVVAVGHSAGGQLALWLAAQRQLSLRGVVGLAAVSDLRKADELKLSRGVVRELLRDDADFAHASPIELLPLSVPQVLLHGTHDEDVPFELSVGYVEAAGERARLIRLEGSGHYEPIDPGSAVWPEVLGAVRTLID
jgi:acetyl esterase/lipase